MNKRWIAIILLLLVVMSIPASAMALTGQERRALWNKYSYRYGDGNPMGWLQTPDFKNPGFETGNMSFWVPVKGYFDSMFVTNQSNGNHHLLFRVISSTHGYEGYFYQDVNLTGATGISFKTTLNNYHEYPTSDGSQYLQVYVDDDKVYEEELTGDYSTKTVYVDDLDYRGNHRVKFNVNYYASDFYMYFDDIHLVGPGF